MKKKSRLTIAFDLDGVLVDTSSIALNILADYNGKELVPTKYDIADEFNILPHVVFKAYAEAFERSSFIHIQPAASRLVSALWGLTGDAITIVTSRESEYAAETHRICEKICGSIPFRLAMVGERGDKESYLGNFDYFVEDRRATALKLVENNVCEVFLINTTYNQMDNHPNIRRINGLDDLFSYDLNNFIE